MCMCHSPKLIAAYHVLHRLSKPRHPPYALCNFFLDLTVILLSGYVYFTRFLLIVYLYNFDLFLNLFYDCMFFQ